ncbi:MAG TPA: hypothetical protein ENI16_00565 [Candidatus Portnoybacteria bacterium]|nr:hypothetical protein [Candidatus Portnoybacteria bacterium]
MEKFKERQPEVESKERFGRNVKIRATFMRHAPKAEASDVSGKSLLSEEGRERAREVGRELEVKQHGIKAYTSPTERAIETADLVLEEQEKKETSILKSRERDELGLIPGSKDFYQQIKKLTKENLPPNYEKLEGEEKEEAFEKAEDKAVDWWLKMGDQKPDNETASPQEMAVSVARLVDRYIRMADRLYSGSEVDLLNVSHKGTLEPFLKEVLFRKVRDETGEEKVVRGFEELEEIGGGMRPTESWTLTIKTNKEGNKSIKLSFRGQECDLDMERLRELVNLSK